MTSTPLVQVLLLLLLKSVEFDDDVALLLSVAGLVMGPVVTLGPTEQEVVDPTGARLEGSKLEPEEPRAEVGFPTADQGFQAFKALCLAFMAFK